MSIIKLDVRDDNIHFELTFDRRINFIIGNSASGKTTLYNMLGSSREDNDIIVDTTYDFILAAVDTYEIMIRESKDAIFIFDDLDVISSASFSDLVKKYGINNNLWFIIMSREDDESLNEAKRLSFSINNIFKLSSENGHYTNIKYYNYSFPQIKHYDKVLIEDTTSGFDFFSNLYKQGVVCSTSGKSTIVDDTQRLINEGNKNILVLFDSAAFGCHISKFDAYFSDDNGFRVSVLSFYECFEELLLRTNLLNRLPMVTKELSRLTDYANNFISWENYFEDLIKRATEDKMYKYNHSGVLRTCYYEPCMKCNPNIMEKCDGTIDGNNKFESLLKDTKYEFLLDYFVG